MEFETGKKYACKSVVMKKVGYNMVNLTVDMLITLA